MRALSALSRRLRARARDWRAASIGYGAFAWRTPCISKYHLRGYAKAGGGPRRLLAVATFSVLPAESTLVELFEDGRFLRSSNELWETAMSEMLYLREVVPQLVWDRAAGLVGIGLDGAGFRAEVLQTAHITLGFLWQESGPFQHWLVLAPRS